jgi:DNA polymerase
MYPTPRIMNDETITYAGSVHKQWKRIKTYGGKLLENITQAASRDILTHNMLRVDDEFKAQIVLDVYDEIVCEVDERSPFNLKTLNGVLTTNPTWATGLPLAAEGFEAHRYAKH